MRAPPLAKNFFIFMQFLGKIGQIIGWCPPLGISAPSSGKSWIRHCNNLIFHVILQCSIDFHSYTCSKGVSIVFSHWWAAFSQVIDRMSPVCRSRVITMTTDNLCTVCISRSYSFWHKTHPYPTVHFWHAVFFFDDWHFKFGSCWVPNVRIALFR